jgi:hypothetical protein
MRFFVMVIGAVAWLFNGFCVVGLVLIAWGVL